MKKPGRNYGGTTLGGVARAVVAAGSRGILKRSEASPNNAQIHATIGIIVVGKCRY